MTKLQEIYIASGKNISKFTTGNIFGYTFLFSSDITVIETHRKIIYE